MSDAAGFAGFPDSALDFYAHLAADNTKSFWTAHKATYDSDVKAPMLALLAALEKEFGPGKAFRPYNDMRFGRATEPYKTHQGAVTGGGTGVGYYVQIDADGLLVGGGYRAHEPAQTKRYRSAVEDDITGSALVRIVATLRKQGYEVHGEQMKTRPRGIAEDHPRVDLLRYRWLIVTKHLGDPAWLSTPRALTEVRKAWRQVRPLRDWVEDHVGAPAG